jgi:hypothetical protein
MLRLLPDGTIAPGWPAGGLLLSTVMGSQEPATIISDGSGGALVFWDDARNVPPAGNGDVYGQRVLADGSIAPGWISGGTAICMAPGTQSLGSASSAVEPPLALPDGSGGAIVVWDDHRDDPSNDFFPDIYAQHITGAGTLDPSWPPTGLPVCVAAGAQRSPQIITDGAGGAIVAWDDQRSGVAEVYAVRINLDGTLAPGWAPNGNLIVSAPGHQFRPWIVPDGTGGALVAFHDKRTAPAIPDSYDYIDIYATRVTAAGELAPGWPVGGVPLSTAPRAQDFMLASPDGAGGMFVAWTDQGGTGARVVRIQGDGTLAPGFLVNGKAIATKSGGQYMDAIAPDGMGGVYLAWENYGAITEVFAQHLTPDGNPVVGWPAAGISMVGMPSSSQGSPSMSPDGLGGAIIVWKDFRPDSTGVPGSAGIYAQRLGIGGPTPVLISLTGAEVEVGLVRLTWYAPQGPGLTATVERRIEESEWLPLGPPQILSDGVIRYEDRSVSPGMRYGYRLGYSDGTGVGYTDETWVGVPTAARFALRGLSPNPSAGDAIVALSLASHEAAGLEVYDISGRLVSSRELGALGPGPHELRLGERGQLAAGVYTVRLRQGGQIVSARAVVIR